MTGLWIGSLLQFLYYFMNAVSYLHWHQSLLAALLVQSWPGTSESWLCDKAPKCTFLTNLQVLLTLLCRGHKWRTDLGLSKSVEYWLSGTINIQALETAHKRKHYSLNWGHLGKKKLFWQSLLHRIFFFLSLKSSESGMVWCPTG